MARSRHPDARFDDGKIESAASTATLRLREQQAWLRNLPTDFDTILDLGAGAGTHSKWFLDRGHSPVAADRYDKAFQFAGQIEFLHKDLEEMDDERRYDAVFCSHVVEHFPNPAASIRRMRDLLNPGGYLFVVVPPYIPVAVNHHWHIGWNCTQLAMLLAACGFDCSQSTFMELGLNVCGWGRKVEVEPTKFHLLRSMPLLPAGIRDSYYTEGADEFLAGDLAIAGPEGAVRKPLDIHFDTPHAGPTDTLSLNYEDEEWQSFEWSFDEEAIDLSAADLRIVIETSGPGDPGIRIAVASDSDEGAWSHSAQRYLGARPGVNCHRFGPRDFRPIEGVRDPSINPNLSISPDFSKIRRLSIGGWGTRTQARLRVILPDGSPLRQPTLPENNLAPLDSET